MARQDQRSRRAATRPALLSTAGCLAAPAPGSPAGFIAGSQEAQGVEIAASDSWDRFDQGSRFDRADADAPLQCRQYDQWVQLQDHDLAPPVTVRVHKYPSDASATNCCD